MTDHFAGHGRFYMVVWCKALTKDHLLLLKAVFSGPKAWSLVTHFTAHSYGQYRVYASNFFSTFEREILRPKCHSSSCHMGFQRDRGPTHGENSDSTQVVLLSISRQKRMKRKLSSNPGNSGTQSLYYYCESFVLGTFPAYSLELEDLQTKVASLKTALVLQKDKTKVGYHESNLSFISLNFEWKSKV